MLHNFALLDFALPAAIFIIVILAIFVFEVVMFIDAARNKSISTDRRILWLIGMILLHPFVAIAYYFTDHLKRPAA